MASAFFIPASSGATLTSRKENSFVVFGLDKSQVGDGYVWSWQGYLDLKKSCKMYVFTQGFFVYP